LNRKSALVAAALGTMLTTTSALAVGANFGLFGMSEADNRLTMPVASPAALPPAAPAEPEEEVHYIDVPAPPVPATDVPAGAEPATDQPVAPTGGPAPSAAAPPPSPAPEVAAPAPPEAPSATRTAPPPPAQMFVDTPEAAGAPSTAITSTTSTAKPVTTSTTRPATTTTTYSDDHGERDD
jgi:hypothetical protein